MKARELKPMPSLSSGTAMESSAYPRKIRIVDALNIVRSGRLPTGNQGFYRLPCCVNFSHRFRRCAEPLEIRVEYSGENRETSHRHRYSRASCRTGARVRAIVARHARTGDPGTEGSRIRRLRSGARRTALLSQRHSGRAGTSRRQAARRTAISGPIRVLPRRRARLPVRSPGVALPLRNPFARMRDHAATHAPHEACEQPRRSLRPSNRARAHSARSRPGAL